MIQVAEPVDRSGQPLIHMSSAVRWTIRQNLPEFYRQLKRVSPNPPEWARREIQRVGRNAKELTKVGDVTNPVEAYMILDKLDDLRSDVLWLTLKRYLLYDMQTSLTFRQLRSRD